MAHQQEERESQTHHRKMQRCHELAKTSAHLEGRADCKGKRTNSSVRSKVTGGSFKSQGDTLIRVDTSILTVTWKKHHQA